MSGAEDVERKRKLAAMREKAAKKRKGGGDGEAEGDDDEAKKQIRFRNYQPYDASLAAPQQSGEAEALPAATSSHSAEPATVAGTKEPELDVIKKELEQFKAEELNVVPKKPNWDLKSQVEGRLDKLKRRTQRAIVDMLRDKMKQEAEADS